MYALQFTSYMKKKSLTFNKILWANRKNPVMDISANAYLICYFVTVP